MDGHKTLASTLRGLKQTPASYLKAARLIEAGEFEDVRRVNIAILSTFTSEFLRPYLVVESAARGMIARPYFGGFNQLEQEALDSASPLYEFEPQVVVIALRLEEIAPKLVTRFAALSPHGVEDELAGIEARLRGLINGLRSNTTATILAFNYASPEYLAAGSADPFLEPSQASVVQRANEGVAEICRATTDAYVFDYARMVYEFGLRRWYDPKLWYLGRIPFGAEAQLETGRRLSRYLRAMCFPPCKCLVLDLDDTLWGGVIGEEGLGGIALGEDYPGNVYKDFQRKLLSLRDQGVLLAVASKNNESDALEVFEKHPDCVMALEDFAVLQIHWQDKATSLRTIAKTLNIGTDALAFFDDNPAEREWVRLEMPEVTVVEVPDSPLGYVRALDESGAFDRLSVSSEDLNRAEMYRDEQERTRLQAQSLGVDEFLQQLDMTATLGFVTRETLPRVAQLLGKTNQFNLTTRRHTASDVEAMIEAGAIALWLRVSDRFGDDGLVGVAIATPENPTQWTVDTFLMSCRVVGRRVESALLSTLSRIIRDRGGQVLVGEYIPTPKNGLTSELYGAHGFERIDGDGRRWRWDFSRGEIPLPEVVKVRFEDGTSD